MSQNASLQSSAKPIYGWIFVVIALAYIYAELHWNVKLIHAISDPGIEKDVVDALVREGRLLASFGLVFALGRKMLVAQRSEIILRAVIFAGIVGVTYWTIGTLYDWAIRAIPPKPSLAIFQLASYRTGILKGEIDDPDLAPLKSDPVAIAAWPIIALDERYLVAVRALYENKRRIIESHLGKDKIAGIERAYRENAADLNKLRQAVAKNAVALGEFDKAYAQVESKLMRKPFMCSINCKLRSVSTTYCGMKLSGDMSKRAFAHQLLVSTCGAEQQKLGEWFLSGAQEEIARHRAKTISVGDHQITAGELADMSERDAHAHLVNPVKEKIAAATSKKLPTLDNIDSVPFAQDVIALLLIPVFALALSIVSSLTNLGSAVATTISLLRPQCVMCGNASFNAIVSIGLASAIIAFLPATTFTYAPAQALEKRLHKELGVSGILLSKIGYLERRLLNHE